MANEIHSLKIGNTEYPIYSEGLKIDDQVSGSAFLVVDGPDNRKVGTSTAIIGNSTSLSLKSDTISIGNGYEGYEPTVIIGDNAEMLYIGGGSTNPVTIHIGAGNDGEAPSTIKMGTPGGSIEIGEEATNVGIGYSADWVGIGYSADWMGIGYSADWVEVGTSAEYMDVGKSATTVGIGNSATTVGIGNSAGTVNIGHMSNSVNVGNQCTGDIVIGAGSVTTSEDEDGNEIVEKTTSTYIGENNEHVELGIKSDNVIIGGGARTVLIGGNTTNNMLIIVGHDNAEAAIVSAEGNGMYGPTQRIMIKSIEDKVTGDDMYSSLLINGVNTMLKSSYNDNYISSIDMGDEYIVISNEQLNDAVGKRISSIELGDKTSGYGGINLTTSQCGINISTQYLADDLSAETGDLGDINIQSSDGKINLNSNSSTNITSEGDLNLTTNHGDIDITSENHSINIDSGTHMAINAAGWIKNLASAFFIGDTINGVPTDEYIEDCTHNVYINAFPYATGGTAAPISIKSGVPPRVITTTRVDGTSVTDNMTSFGGLSSLTNVEIGKYFNIKNDIISNNFFPNNDRPNAATLIVGNKLKDSYTDTSINVPLKVRTDAEGVISMRVNDVYETNNGADVHSTIELTPTNYKLQNICIDNNDMCNTVYIDTNASLDINKHSVSIGCSSNNNSTESTYYQSNIKLYGEYDDLAGAVSIFAESYDGERTAMLDMKYNGITLSYDNQFDTTDTYINMGCDALKLYYNNAGYGVDEIISLGIDGTTITSSNLKVDAYGGNETIELGTDGTTITSSNLKVNASNLQMPVPIGNGTVNKPGIKLYHPNSNGTMGTIMYCNSNNQYIVPIANYSAGSNVNLGTATKRFGSIFVNAGYATTSFTSSSDERLKDFGDDIAVDLDALAALRKSYYRWNETSGFENEKDRMLGMSAQEVQNIYPEVVNTDEDGMLSMAYDRLSVVALAAIDKLHETNKELKAENDELKERLTRLENLVNEKLSTM